MRKNEKIISIFVPQKEYDAGAIDVTEKLYEAIPKDQIEAVKYMMPSSVEKGIYFNIVLIKKEADDEKKVGF
ncbi:MAG: hypothetical protein AAFR61_06530 [Bacteroidota bacterium]